ATAASVLVWDHILTIEREVRYIWFNKGIRLRSQLLFAMNRYATTVMILYMAYVIIILRIYTLWDKRRKVAYILVGAFFTAISITTAFTSLFDLFIVVMVTFNVLDRPRTFQVKVLHELQRDGFRMFLGLFCRQHISQG
ncbi:hypothetical protein BDQ17DRAFT_1267057, partial [Cyathus striatus]